MRVVYLAAGAAGMYCGSCIRDNRLAATLRSQGRDIKLVPLYTPVRTDEQDASERRVFYGGINVYLEQKSALFRHLPRGLSSLLDLPALLNGVGKMAARTDPGEVGALTVSVLAGPDGAQARELEHLVSGLRGMQPGLINLPNLMFLGIARPLREALQVPVLVTLGGEDIFLDRLPEPYRQQCFDRIQALANDADGYIALSDYYANHCEEHFGLPRERITAVPPGIAIDYEPRTAEPAAPPLTIAFVGRVCRDKGFDLVCDAMIELRRRGHDCRLEIAGYRGPNEEPFLAEQLVRLEEQGCDGRFRDHGEVSREEKFDLLRNAHVFTMPSTFPEAKGIPVLEALSVGVPVVQPERGSFGELVRTTGGGVLYDPDEPEGLTDALEALLQDGGQRVALGQAGCTAVRDDFNADAIAERVWQVYEQHAQAFGANV